MASISNHYLDIFNWIKLVIDSSITVNHTICIDRLIVNYSNFLNLNTKLDSDFKRQLIRELHLYHLTKIEISSKENLN